MESATGTRKEKALNAIKKLLKLNQLLDTWHGNSAISEGLGLPLDFIYGTNKDPDVVLAKTDWRGKAREAIEAFEKEFSARLDEFSKLPEKAGGGQETA